MDIGLMLDMFDDAFRAATAANDRGDTAKARTHFLRAALIMDDIADKSEPPLDAERRERANKIRAIAEKLQSKAKPNDEFDLLNIKKPDDKVSFDDIVGLLDAKAAIHDLLIDPLKKPDVYKKYGLKAGGTILLEGPPGTGKTTFCKAAACEISVPFAEVNANSLVDSYIGKTGKNIDRLFDQAHALSKKSGVPIVLFIDEIDYLAQRRGGENKTAAEAVPTLIKRMDGFSSSSDDIVLIAATNIKESLDPAILSRFRNIIYIGLPEKSERELLFKKKLAQLDERDACEIDFIKAAELSASFSGRDITQVSLDLKNALAARDAGIRKLLSPVNELLQELIKRRAAAKL